MYTQRGGSFDTIGAGSNGEDRPRLGKITRLIVVVRARAARPSHPTRGARRLLWRSPWSDEPPHSRPGGCAAVLSGGVMGSGLLGKKKRTVLRVCTPSADISLRGVALSAPLVELASARLARLARRLDGPCQVVVHREESEPMVQVHIIGFHGDSPVVSRARDTDAIHATCEALRVFEERLGLLRPLARVEPAAPATRASTVLRA